MLRLYRLANILSLDVAIGAVICSAFFAHIIHGDASVIALICLGLTVWLIYTADHLLDGYRLKEVPATLRHKFHQKHFKTLLIIFCVTTITDAVLITQLPSQLFFNGVILASFVIIYFVIQRRLFFLKEFVGSILYTIGVLMPVATFYTGSISILIICLCIIFFLIALINLVLFSLFDYEYDLNHQHNSIVTTLGARNTRYVLVGLFASAYIMIIYIVNLNPTRWIEATTLFSMTTLLLIIFIRPKWFSQHDRYRLLGDAVFLLPLMILIK